MKILILNYEYPPIGGGGGVVSKYHAEGLVELGHKVTVLTTWFKGEEEIITQDNLTIIKLESRRKYIHKSGPLDWLSWIKKTKKYFSENVKSPNYDLCIAHFALPCGEVARYIKKKYSIPYLIVSHGQDIPWFFPKQMFKYHLITYFWIKAICKRAEKLILLTQDMKKNADQFMGKFKHKNFVIPNGCETKNFFPDFSKRKDVLTILFVGRLVDQKSPFVFLKAIEQLKNRANIQFQVEIYGDGPLKNKMEQVVVNKELSNFVKFNGWVSKEQLLVAYQSAHVHVISSDAEAMSIAALEALSTGIYLISTPVSGNTDVIDAGVNGDFFKFGNSVELTEKVEHYYQTKFKSEYKVPEQFLVKFREKYDWSGVVKKLEQVINEL